MRSAKRITALAALLGLVGTVVVQSVTQSAGAVASPEFVGWSGGSVVSALDGTVTSGYTAASSIGTPSTGEATSNGTVTTSVAGVLTGGAVTTSEQTTPVTGGGTVTSTAQTVGLSLLGGLISVSAVTTRASATVVDGSSTGAASTSFVGLHIAGATVPLTVAKNFTLTIPGIAQVVLNAAYVVPAADGTVRVDAAAIYVSLLKSQGSSPAGTEIYVDPVHAAIAAGVPSSATPVGGFAYATRATAAAGTLLSVGSGPTAYSLLGGPGTGGQTVDNATAALNLPGIATASALSTSETGTATPALSSARLTVGVTGVDLLGGLITADALQGVATATQAAGGPIELAESTTITNLVIAGVRVAADVKPNTVISIGGIATVTVNAQVQNATTAAVRLLDVTLTTAAYGLPAGAELEVGAAAAWIGHP